MGNDSIIAFKTREQLRKYLWIFSPGAKVNEPDRVHSLPQTTEIVERRLEVRKTIDRLWAQPYNIWPCLSTDG